MNMRIRISRTLIGTALSALAAAGTAVAVPAPVAAQTVAPQPTNRLILAVSEGRLVRLPANMTDLFVANPGIADVQVRSANQLYIFGKSAGETTLYATNAAGKVIYSTNIRVGNNITSVDDMLRVTMPEAKIQATTLNNTVLLTGTVATPADVEDAERLVQAYVGEGTQIISRLKTATPLQVMLKVTFAEVSRSLLKNVGVNLQSTGDFGNTGGFNFVRGRDFLNNNGQYTYTEGSSALGIFGTLFGANIASDIDLNETSGLSSILAEPTLVALSGETASFLAGGEFPIPISNGINGVSVEFKSYGVGLAFTPTVLENGRISMRVLPEVSEISAENSVTLNSFEVPSLITRRTETTVELGSGQSFMISGLLRNNSSNSVERTPFLGNLPILGSLFRSNGFRRNQTELVIIITPYLVKPVNASQVALPTDGFRTSSDPDRLLLDKMHDSRSGETRPMPRMAPPQTATPTLAPSSASVAPAAPTVPPSSTVVAKPGFGF
ncbi:MAG TPA: type II and III secretion system protein family protein [Allosphingosinicella sp.]|uniref:type II and III secretion system protein family protein n=1 Tax=Allosphingosinicella sp. TaxID=2823234 RepID=UPI002EDB0620